MLEIVACALGHQPVLRIILTPCLLCDGSTVFISIELVVVKPHREIYYNKTSLSNSC